MKDGRASTEYPNRRLMTNRSTQYEIRVDGRVDAGWSAWFPGMRVIPGEADSGEMETVLRGAVPDQSALRGILGRIWDLGLTILAVRRLPESGTQGE